MIYLDNSATTPLTPAVKDSMMQAMEAFGNPSSLHSLGLAAEKIVSASRDAIFFALNIRNKDAYRLYFTSSGSEANNQILFGAARAKNFRFTPRIITTDSEHPSVLEPLSVLKNSGVEVVTLSTKGGKISLDEVREAVNERTILISIMAVNNETGAIYDLKSIFSLAKRLNPQVITHTDCVQGFMKIPFSPEIVMADAVSLSAHKIHGPKGVGALLLSKALITAKRVTPLIYGGGQEGGMRSGTENVIGIAGFGAAAKEAAASLTAFREEALALREAFLSALPQEVKINQPEKFTPHIISITLPRLRSETLLHRLSAEGIFVSSGSACASNKKGSNYVLPAFGLSSEDADSTLRISLSRNTTKEDLLFTAKRIAAAMNELIKR